MTDHLHGCDIERLVTNRATLRAVGTASLHMRNCPECSGRLFSTGAYGRLIEMLATPPAEPLVRRRRAAGARFAIEAAAVAAVAAIVFVVVRGDQRLAPPVAAAERRTVPSVSVQSREWDALTAKVSSDGRLPESAIAASLRESDDTPRGTAPENGIALSPAGVVLDVTRPRFTWQAFPRATYSVQVKCPQGEIYRSGVLSTAEWSPAVDFARGATYEWQVKITRGSRTVVAPGVALAPALFHVTSEREHRELESARRQRPSDHLLIAALAARAGLYEDARRSLAELARSPQAAALASKLSRGLDEAESRASY